MSGTKDFHASVSRGDKTVSVIATGFPPGGGSSAFVVLKLGGGFCETNLFMDPAEARAIADALLRAASHAGAHAADAADVGISA